MKSLIIYINARSLIKNFEAIELLCYKMKPMILCCSEARTTEDILDGEITIEGYECIRSDSDSRHTGGVIMYIKNNIKYKIMETISIKNSIWCLSIEALDCAHRGIYGVIYRSPNAKNNNEQKKNKKSDNTRKEGRVKESLNLMDEWLDRITNLRKKMIIMGDVNIDQNKMNSNLKKFINIIKKYDLSQIINFYTYEEGNTRSTIDIVLTNDTEYVKCYPKKDETITDHETIYIEVNESIYNKNEEAKTIISWKNYNKNDLINILTYETDWMNFQTKDINEKVRMLRANIVNATEKLTKKIKWKNRIKCNGWFDNTLDRLKHEKVKLYKNWKNYKNEIYWMEYKQKRNEYNDYIKRKKNEHS